MKFNLDGKVVVVTGGSGLLGSAVCDSISNSGGIPLSFDIKPNDSELVSSFFCDCTSKADLLESLTKAKNMFSCITGAVHCAYPRSNSWGQTFEESDFDRLSEDISLQLGSAILFSQVMHKLFLEQQTPSSFVHVSSIQGISAPKFEHYLGTSMTSPIEYSAIKSGIISITRWLAKYSFNTGIRFNCVSPGGIFDNQDPVFLRRYRSTCASVGMLQPSDVSSVISYLLSDFSSAITGQNIVVDDGWSL